MNLEHTYIYVIYICIAIQHMHFSQYHFISIAYAYIYYTHTHTHTCLCLCACAPVVCVVDAGVHACIYSTRIRTRGTHIIHTNAKAKGTRTALAGFAALIFGYSGQISPDPGFSNPGRGRSTLRNPRGIRGRSTPLELGSGRVGSLAA